jgi:hypothetical protein
MAMMFLRQLVACPTVSSLLHGKIFHGRTSKLDAFWQRVGYEPMEMHLNIP